jgi:hypothetical protein
VHQGPGQFQALALPAAEIGSAFEQRAVVHRS